MDRQQFKFISALLALLMFISPFSTLAMQPVMSDSQSSHCHGLQADSQCSQHETADMDACKMENCAESCGTSLQCSSQAPIILTLLDTQIHSREQKSFFGQITDTHLSMPLPGLYRPPRL